MGQHRVDHVAGGQIVVGIRRDNALRLVDQWLPFVRESDRSAGSGAHSRHGSSHIDKGMYAAPVASISGEPNGASLRRPRRGEPWAGSTGAVGGRIYARSGWPCIRERAQIATRRDIAL